MTSQETTLFVPGEEAVHSLMRILGEVPGPPWITPDVDFYRKLLVERAMLAIADSSGGEARGTEENLAYHLRIPWCLYASQLLVRMIIDEINQQSSDQVFQPDPREKVVLGSDRLNPFVHRS